MKKILYLGPPDFQSTIQQELGSDYSLVWVQAEAESVRQQIADAVVWFDASMKIPLKGELLAQAKQLKLVITATTGADHIDHKELEARGIPLLTLRGHTDLLNSLTPAAELSWLLLMACARRLRSAIHHVENGGWDRELFPGFMLKNKTLGIIGCGRLGGWMARYGQAFDMKVIGFDPYLQELPPTILRTTLDEVLTNAHFVTIHVPYNDQTKGLLGARELGLMRPNAVLVNTSRGAIVNEQALLEGLKAGKPAALGVDVLEGEPDIKKSLIWQYAQSHDNVVITPHIGGFSPDALEIVLRFTARRVVEYFNR